MSTIFTIPESFIARKYTDKTTPSKYRTHFMRDRDRILYCTAFRRLSGKTQIYTVGTDDHKKNRLTHSLEVSQISRTIARALGLNCDLSEAIALAHDLGHTPFGHAGEEMLHKILIPESNYIKGSPFYQETAQNISNRIGREINRVSGLTIDNLFGFKHNLQSVRAVCTLEDTYRNEKGENIGLNLTNYTLWGIPNHSKLKYHSADLYPNYLSCYASNFLINGQEDKEAWSFEAYVVRIADEIAQWHHDLEDAIRGEAIPVSSICETINKALERKLNPEDTECIENIRQVNKIDRKGIAELSRIVVNTLVNDLVETSQERMQRIISKFNDCCRKSMSNTQKSEHLYQNYDELDVRDEYNEVISRDKVIALSDSIDHKVFENTIREGIHHSRDVERMNEKGKHIIRKLFEAYYSHPQQLPDGPIFHIMVDIGKYANINEATKEGAGKIRIELNKELENPTLIVSAILMRRICDHIASMTDRYAIEEYKNLYG